MKESKKINKKLDYKTLVHSAFATANPGYESTKLCKYV